MKIIEILLPTFRKQSIKANWIRPVVFPIALSNFPWPVYFTAKKGKCFQNQDLYISNEFFFMGCLKFQQPSNLTALLIGKDYSLFCLMQAKGQSTHLFVSFMVLFSDKSLTELSMLCPCWNLWIYFTFQKHIVPKFDSKQLCLNFPTVFFCPRG